MMKEQLVTDIAGRLSALGIQAVMAGGTDISLNKTFLDAAWGTGKKEIHYEASIFCDESVQTVFMYELTTEVGSGFSFGGSSESTFQSGATLYRKVKAVQYGPDGKAYEISLNLGAISAAVKDAARQYGWKLKTVLSKAKAMYPAGYGAPSVPSQPVATAKGFCTGCGSPLAVDARFCSKCGKRLVE